MELCKVCVSVRDKKDKTQTNLTVDHSEMVSRSWSRIWEGFSYIQLLRLTKLPSSSLLPFSLSEQRLKLERQVLPHSDFSLTSRCRSWEWGESAQTPAKSTCNLRLQERVMTVVACSSADCQRFLTARLVHAVKPLAMCLGKALMPTITFSVPQSSFQPS